jgi:hypothetical protein
MVAAEAVEGVGGVVGERGVFRCSLFVVRRLVFCELRSGGVVSFVVAGWLVGAAGLVGQDGAAGQHEVEDG